MRVPLAERRRPHLRLQPLLRWLPLVAALFLAGRAATLHHFASVDHGWCAEHQAFEHQPLEHHAHADDCAHGDAPHESPPDAPPSEPRDASHDPCHVPAALRHGFMPPEPPPPAVTLTLLPVAWIAPRCDVALRPASLAPWLLAPKNSPPA